MKATIIGGGNIGMALAEGLIQAKLCTPQDIVITRRRESSFGELAARGFRTSTDNAKAIEGADSVFICVLPQQLDEALEQLKPSVNFEKQLFVSVVTGVHTQVFRNKLGNTLRIIRAMPNTAMKVGESMTCLSAINVTAADIK